MMATVAFILHPQKPIWNITFPVCHSWAYTFFFNAKLGAILTKKCTSPNALIYPSRCAGVHTYTTIVHKTSFREAFHIFAIFILNTTKTFHFFFADSISAQTLEKDENGVMQMQLLSIQTDRGKEKSYPRLQAEC